jgi:uncharacterized protein with HEPN domain
MLPDERDAAHLWNMVKRARYLLRKSAAITFEQLASEEDHQLAVAKALELIGESGRKVSDSFRAAHPGLPWNEIKGMRNVLVHEYEHVNWSRIWETLTVSIPALLAQIEPLLPDPPADESHGVVEVKPLIL